jgi:hypothetical protein
VTEDEIAATLVDPAGGAGGAGGAGAGGPGGTVRGVPRMSAGGAAVPAASADTVAAPSSEGLATADAAATVAGDRYREGAEIARGGMGRVIEATDGLLGRSVAIKAALATDPDALRRFARETRITARLEHPSIVPVYDAGTAPDGSPFYVMRKVSGQPLEKLVFEANALDERLALLPNLLAAAQAIAHAHRRGIIHRDLKPSNILVGDLGETIVIDWGLAKVLGEADESSGEAAPAPAATAASPSKIASSSFPSHEIRTRYGAVLGTPGFMPAEQIHSSDVDERADVYALGGCLYYLLTRRPPHAADTGDAMLLAASSGPPVPLDELVRGAPRELVAICDKALAYDAPLRYANAGELAEDLQRFLAGQLVASHRYSAGERLGRFVRRHRALVVTVAAALTLLAAGAWFAVGRIVSARDDAVAQAHAATAARERETERATELVLSQARVILDANPAAAVALVRPFAASPRWREVRAIAAGARAAGVPWRLPSSPTTTWLAFSPDGARAVSCGGDGEIRLHDLAARATRDLVRAQPGSRAIFVDDHRLAIWRASTLTVYDLRATTRTVFERPSKIARLAAAGGALYGTDADRRAWRLDPDRSTVTPLVLDDDIRVIAAAPGGAAIAFGGEFALWLADARDPSRPPERLADARVHDLAWDPGAPRLLAMIAGGALDVTLEPARHIEQLPDRNDLGARARGHRHTFGLGGRLIDDHPVRAGDLASSLLGLHVARGDIVVNASPASIQLSDGLAFHELFLPPPGGPLSALAASARSPYVIAAARDLLLLWDLDDVLPRRIPVPPYTQLSSVGPHDVWTTSLRGPARWIDLATGAASDLPQLAPVRVSAPPSGDRAVAIELQQTVARVFRRGAPGGAPEPLPFPVDLAAFLDEDRVAYTSGDRLAVHDLAAGRSITVADLPGARTLVARAPWLAAAAKDGRLLRANLANPAAPAVAELRLTGLGPIASPAADGRLWLAAGRRLHSWAPSGDLALLAELPAPAQQLLPLDARRVLVTCADDTAHIVSLDAPGVLGPAPPAGRALSFAPDPGLLAIADRKPGLELVDLAAPMPATARIARSLPADTTPLLTPDGLALVTKDPAAAGQPDAILVWRLDLPRTPEATARWIEHLTNADYDPRLARLSWR